MKRLTLALLLIFVINALLGGDAKAYDTNASRDTSAYGQWYQQQAQQSAYGSTGQQQTDSNVYNHAVNQGLRGSSCKQFPKYNSFTGQYEYVLVCN